MTVKPQAKCPVCGELKDAHTLSSTGCYECDMEQKRDNYNEQRRQSRPARAGPAPAAAPTNLRDELAARGREWLERRKAEPLAAKAQARRYVTPGCYVTPGSYSGRVQLPPVARVDTTRVDEKVTFYTSSAWQAIPKLIVTPTLALYDASRVDCIMEMIGNWDTVAIHGAEIEIRLLVCGQPVGGHPHRQLLLIPHEQQYIRFVRGVAGNITGRVTFTAELKVTEALVRNPPRAAMRSTVVKMNYAVLVVHHPVDPSRQTCNS